MDRIRVSLVHNFLTPYMVPVFNEIGSRRAVNLKVYSMAELESNRQWKVQKNLRFDHEILKGVHLEYGAEDVHTLHINPHIHRRLTEDEPDVIVSSGYSSPTNQLAFLYAKKARVPFLLWSGSTARERSVLRTLLRPYVSQLVKRCNGYIAYGSAARDYLVSLGAPKERISIAYNTVDVLFFVDKTSSKEFANHRQHLRCELGVDQQIVVLYVGQLIKRKGLTTLIKAIQLTQKELEVGLVLVGTGKETEALKNEAANVKKVVFVGHVDYDRLARYYGAADIFVLPSFEEVWGLVVNEAMACGLPVISSTAAGCTRDLVIDDVNGYAFEAGNVEMLASRILAIASDRNKMREFGRMSRKIVQDRFTVSHCADGIEEAIRNVVQHF